MGNRTENSQAALRLEGGQLDIKGTYAGISCPEVDIAGGTGTVSALGQCGIGIYSCRIKVEESEGEMTAEGSGAAVLAGVQRWEIKPSHKVRWKSDGRNRRCPGCGADAAQPGHMAGHAGRNRGMDGGLNRPAYIF
ncbi:MAG: hypothetical protein ACLSAC_19695 [Enterocloster bolteae]